MIGVSCIQNLGSRTRQDIAACAYLMQFDVNWLIKSAIRICGFVHTEQYGWDTKINAKDRPTPAGPGKQPQPVKRGEALPLYSVAVLFCINLDAGNRAGIFASMFSLIGSEIFQC